MTLLLTNCGYRKPPLQLAIQQALAMPDSDFAYHETDLLVVERPGLRKWLWEHYAYPQNIRTFVGNGPWDLLICLDIPFEGIWTRYQTLAKSEATQ